MIKHVPNSETSLLPNKTDLPFISLCFKILCLQCSFQKVRHLYTSALFNSYIRKWLGAQTMSNVVRNRLLTGSSAYTFRRECCPTQTPHTFFPVCEPFCQTIKSQTSSKLNSNTSSDPRADFSSPQWRGKHTSNVRKTKHNGLEPFSWIEGKQDDLGNGH